jgi:hypothetical protein
MHVCVAFVETQFKFVGASIHALKRNRIVYEHLGALYMPVRAENGQKFFGPARPGPARCFAARPGKFRELSLQCSRIVFYLVLSMFRETFRKFSSLDRGKRQHEA